MHSRGLYKKKADGAYYVCGACGPDVDDNGDDFYYWGFYRVKDWLCEEPPSYTVSGGKYPETDVPSDDFRFVGKFMKQ